MIKLERKVPVILLLLILVSIGCQEKTTGPAFDGSSATVVLRLNYQNGNQWPQSNTIRLYPKQELTMGVFQKPIYTSPKQSQGFAKSKLSALIDRGEVVFYDLNLDSTTLMQNDQDSLISAQINEFLNQQPPPQSFPDFLGIYERVLDILTEGNSREEKRDELNIVGNRARGEFRVAEGIKLPLIGLFEGSQLMYFGTPESPIYASPDDTTFVNLFLSYAGPLDLVITLPEDNFSTTQRVIPIEGTVRSGQEVDYSSLSATLSVNDNISQKIAIDTLSGFFFTSALLPQRNNRIEVSVADSINNQLVSDQITVSFTGTFPFLRAALSWDGQADLDLHMINPNGLECYFSNPQVGGMELDVDNTSGFGPENISVTTDTIPGLYNVFVRNFSSTLGITANVKIFKYNPNIDEEELIDEQSRLFSDVNDWIVGDYTLP